jgi:hypothetical protein
MRRAVSLFRYPVNYIQYTVSRCRVSEAMKSLLLLTLLLGIASGSLLPRMAEDGVADVRRELLDTVSGLWRSYQDPAWRARSDPMEEVLRGFSVVDEKMRKLGRKMPNETPGAALFLEGLWPWATALANVQNLDNFYDAVQTAIKSRIDLNVTAEGVVSPQEESKSIQSALSKLHEVAVKKDEGGLFEGVVRAASKVNHRYSSADNACANRIAFFKIYLD